jgi:hypothetical protein
MRSKQNMLLDTFVLTAPIVNSPDQTSIAFVTHTTQKRLGTVQTVWVLSRRTPQVDPIFRVTGPHKQIWAVFWTQHHGIVIQMGANLVQLSPGGKPRTLCALPPNEDAVAFFDAGTVVAEVGEVGDKVLYNIHTGKTISLGNFLLGSPRSSGQIPIACPMDESDLVSSIGLLNASGRIQSVCTVGRLYGHGPELSQDEQNIAISLQPKDSGNPTLNIIGIRSRKCTPIRDYRGALVYGRSPRWAGSHSLLFVAPDRGSIFVPIDGVGGLPNESEAMYEFNFDTRRVTRVWPN